MSGKDSYKPPGAPSKPFRTTENFKKNYVLQPDVVNEHIKNISFKPYDSLTRGKLILFKTVSL